MKKFSIAQARRIALGAQGFCDPAPSKGVTLRHFRRVLDRMTILQLDSVNVLCRSHFLPVFARLGPYDRDRLDAWLWGSGENLEFLAHEASLTKMEVFPLLQHRMTIERWKSGTRFLKDESNYLRAVLAKIENAGPLSVKDFADTHEHKAAWWGWSKRKLALQVLLRTGQLSVAERTKSFLTRYDFTHRVVPEKFRSSLPLGASDAQRSMLMLAAKSIGVGTDKDLADYFRLRVTSCRPLLKELCTEGLLEEVQVEGWDEPTFLAKGSKRPRSVNARAFLSPFDPLIWFRPRAARLFGFDYRIEIYVPEAKRKFGYYVLPFLLGDQLVGRVDLKADRQAGKLLAKAAYIEPGHSPDLVAPAMATSLKEMAQWLGLQSVSVGRKGNLARALNAARS